MAYQPTLFTPLDVAQRINDTLLPLETSMQCLAKQMGLKEAPAQQPQKQEMMAHNLNCLTQFKAQQQTIIDQYIQSQHLNLKR